jgi:hypothetical protein
MRNLLKASVFVAAIAFAAFAPGVVAQEVSSSSAAPEIPSRPGIARAI